MKKLLFVHNANSGFLSSVIDGVHKMTRPSTYDCELCALTFGAVSMKKQWKDFLESLPIEVESTYRDKLALTHPEFKDPLPGVFIEENGKLTQLIDKKQFESFDGLDDLIKMVKQKLK